MNSLSRPVLAIIQARMGSERLPGKVLQDIGGRPMLDWVVSRTEKARSLDGVVVATTTDPRDDAVADWARSSGKSFFRGSERDVLDRYYQAACRFGAGSVVRITADCPLIDPGLIDGLVGAFEKAGADYASNVADRRYPRGLDCEVFSFAALEKSWKEARASYQREHVTYYLEEHPEMFRFAGYTDLSPQEDFSGYRWTVDTPEDLALIRELVARAPADFSWREVLEIVRREPSLCEINRHVAQKGEKSVQA